MIIKHSCALWSLYFSSLYSIKMKFILLIKLHLSSRLFSLLVMNFSFHFLYCRHSSIKDKKSRKPPCNIRTNPGYDERYSSTKSINESQKHDKSIHRCRKSTSDLTDMTDDAGITTPLTSLSRPSSPRRKGSVKGGLAYLASRRGSRDSVASNMSNLSNEDIGPLNFQNTARGRQRRTSNFLELPGK